MSLTFWYKASFFCYCSCYKTLILYTGCLLMNNRFLLWQAQRAVQYFTQCLRASLQSRPSTIKYNTENLAFRQLCRLTLLASYK